MTARCRLGCPLCLWVYAVSMSVVGMSAVGMSRVGSGVAVKGRGEPNWVGVAGHLGRVLQAL